MKIKKIKPSMKCDDAIKCVFDLNTLDIKVYKQLKKIGPVRANELAKYLNRERSTVYRSLQKLSACGVCEKTTKTLLHGGYYHEYSCNSIKDIQKRAKECLDQWYFAIKNTLDQLND